MTTGQSPRTGTDQERARTRQAVWDKMAAVARPDSRFGYDLTSFIPDFAGSELGCRGSGPARRGELLGPGLTLPRGPERGSACCQKQSCTFT